MTDIDITANDTHYGVGGLELKDIFEELSPKVTMLSYIVLIMKYAFRCKHKGQYSDDIRKIRTYISLAIKASETLYDDTDISSIRSRSFEHHTLGVKLSKAEYNGWLMGTLICDCYNIIRLADTNGGLLVNMNQDNKKHLIWFLHDIESLSWMLPDDA